MFVSIFENSSNFWQETSVKNIMYLSISILSQTHTHTDTVIQTLGHTNKDTDTLVLCSQTQPTRKEGSG